MDTLYDLLGALPHDDAEDLRVAFRRAVKGAHPDIRPGDPDAALKFRQIVRANEILIDKEQRAAYDHLLALARVEQRSASFQPIAAWIHSLATGVVVLAAISIVAVGTYLLFMQMSTASVAPASSADVTTRVSPDIAAVRPTDATDQTDASAVHANPERAEIPSDAIVLSTIIPLTNVESISPLNVSAAPDPAPNDARSFRARGISAYRNGDLTGAIADLDHAIQLDPSFAASYIDRSIVFYRLRKFDRAFADIERAKEIKERAKEIKKESRSKSSPMTARKPRFEQAGRAPSVTPLYQRRTARPPEEGFASLTFQ
jgi:curved DNA-binding protein CbpA